MTRKGCTTILIYTLFGAIVAIAGAWIWLSRWNSDSEAIKNEVVAIDYYDSPPLIALHLNQPPQVFLIRNLEGENLESARLWLNPANVEIEFVEASADSIYDKWADRLDDHDLLQMGVHGKALAATPTFPDGTVAEGVAIDKFAPGSFELISEEEFAALKPGTPVLKRDIYGHFRFARHRHIHFLKYPTSHQGF